MAFAASDGSRNGTLKNTWFPLRGAKPGFVPSFPAEHQQEKAHGERNNQRSAKRQTTRVWNVQCLLARKQPTKARCWESPFGKPGHFEQLSINVLGVLVVLMGEVVIVVWKRRGPLHRCLATWLSGCVIAIATQCMSLFVDVVLASFVSSGDEDGSVGTSKGERAPCSYLLSGLISLVHFAWLLGL